MKSVRKRRKGDVTVNALGVILAKSGSVRAPNKNIADIEGHPTMFYPIQALRTSGICDKIIVSTDSECYGEIALECGADSFLMRDAATTKFSEKPGWFAVTANTAANEYQEITGHRFSEVVVCGANVMFLRPSWLRAACTLLYKFLYNETPIDVVGMEPYHWNVNVCRFRKGIALNPQFFVLKHIGILMEMDWPHEIELARQIQKCIRKGTVHYPLSEDVHDEILANIELAPARMRGLSVFEESEKNDVRSI